MNQAIFWDILRIIVQIFLLTTLYYWILRLLKGSPGFAQINVCVLFLVFIYSLSSFLRFPVLRWIVEKIFSSLPVILIVLFQGEIRHILGIFGTFAGKILPTVRSHHNQENADQTEQMVDALTDAAIHMSKTKTGALIAIQQTMNLSDYAKTGKQVDALLLPGNGLVETIFYKGSPLHDGGMVVRGNRIEATGCLFPFCDNEAVRNDYGMRHQAATGLSEKTDALVLVVSEETGIIHLVSDGVMTAILDQSRLKDALKKSLHASSPAEPTVFDKILIRFRALTKIFLPQKKTPDTTTKG